ncbi:MAG: enolase superfamily enzyme related to L-alanine-DL-glutamate epimerase, partial [Devosia sp.]|nr:enolase superfamily enzyme related to L-alanine-DL-glutamate epimerase [Devosia sp.]
MSDTRIDSIEAQLFRVPLPKVMTDAKHGAHTHFELVTVTIHAADGRKGVGYTYTGGKGGHAIRAVIEHDLAPALLGLDSTEIDTLYDAMWWHIHYVGRGGITSFAISAIDIALWDLKGQREGLPLWKMAGGADASAKVYRGGIDLNYTLDELLESVEGYLS